MKGADSVLKIRERAVEWREIEGEIVAIDLRHSLYFALNQTAALLWPLLVGGATRGELVRTLSDKWGVPAASAEGDVEGFLTMLRDQDLLEPEGSLR